MRFYSTNTERYVYRLVVRIRRNDDDKDDKTMLNISDTRPSFRTHFSHLHYFLKELYTYMYILTIVNVTTLSSVCYFQIEIPMRLNWLNSARKSDVMSSGWYFVWVCMRVCKRVFAPTLYLSDATLKKIYVNVYDLPDKRIVQNNQHDGWII